MEVKLRKKPKSPIIIDGFPGFGMVGTIATEFLIEHLKTEQIGKIILEDDMPALVAIHGGKIVEPLGIFYNKKYNIVIVHAIGGTIGTEWKVSESILKIAKDLKAREIISLEGVGSSVEIDESKMFYYTADPRRAGRFAKLGIEQLKEGIIMGVTSALLLKAESTPVTCIFAETHMNLPDSKAAAKIVEALDKYLDLKVDYKPLLDVAKRLEGKLKQIMQQSKVAATQRDKSALNYVG
ncbi:hypothetical protein AUJ69_02135 [Candidatus Woesearchaeota archaeon CG1_02_47_18]|nr:MAG: hypothetical protein AUJ69_02135 [Candidatus Woesearchaeota archaeon CG1_02_47_18]